MSLTLLCISLSGCATKQASIVASVQSLIRGNEAVDTAPLRPDLRYLRVTIRDKAILMVLGYVDKDADGHPVMVWFSADGEVLRTQAGRLVGLTGTPWEWRNVRLSADLPAWSGIDGARHFSRQSDQMPGYRWSHVDRMVVRPIAPPSQGDVALQAWDPSALKWFEENAEDGRVPPARYALAPGQREPLYGEQCLHPSFCLAWQTWPARPSTSQP